MEVSTQIMFEKQSYFSGEVIRGQIIVINGTSIPQRLRERISLSFDGFSKTNLAGKKVTNQHSALVSTNRRNSVGQEVYLQTKIFLTPEDYTSVELAVGQNGFPFQFELPTFLPSSYFCPLGAVHYEAAVSFSIGYIYPVKCTNKITFRVINSQDLNLNSLAGLNSYFSFEKLIPMGSSFRIRKGHQFGIVNATVKIPSQGYVPGEIINMVMQIFYPSGIEISKVLVSLISETSFTCPGGSMDETAVLSSCVASRPRWAEQGQLEARLEIPSQTLPSAAHTCYLISMKYFVTINIQLPHVLQAVTVGKFPVIIGTIPLRQIEAVRRTGSQRAAQPQQREQRTQLEIEGATGGNPHAPSAPSWRIALNDEDFGDIPPTYLEALSMTAPGSPTLAIPEEDSESS